MSIQVRTVDREFSPSEASAITGVSVALQRDWRRRGILPENPSGKWTRFSVAHVIEMCVMKLFSDAGVSVSLIRDAAAMAVLPTLQRLHQIPEATVFEGEPLSQSMKERVTSGAVVGAKGRYLVSWQDQAGEPTFGRFATLAGVEDYLLDFSAPLILLLDFEAIAKLIWHRVDGPLFRHEVEVSE